LRDGEKQSIHNNQLGDSRRADYFADQVPLWLDSITTDPLKKRRPLHVGYPGLNDPSETRAEATFSHAKPLNPAVVLWC
jgi:hypothetical protein